MFTLGLNKQKNRDAVDRISRWIREVMMKRYFFVNTEEIQLIVQEVLCNEPGCAPIETLVAIFLESKLLNNFIQPLRYSTKILKPIQEVIRSDVDSIQLPFKFQNATLEHLQLSLGEDITTATSLYADKSLIKEMLKRLLEGSQMLVDKEEEKIHDEVTKKRQFSTQVTRVEMVPVKETGDFYKKEPKESALLKDSVSIEPILREIPMVRPVISQESTDSSIKPRHDKEIKRRGCPCCDPDNLDNLVDKMIFMEYPPM